MVRLCFPSITRKTLVVGQAFLKAVKPVGLKSDVALKLPIKFQVSYFKSKLYVYYGTDGSILSRSFC